MSLGDEYLKVVQDSFYSTKELGEKAISQLTEDDIHWVFNEASNSVAVIVKHLSGNMLSRWSDFLTSDGEKTSRNRDDEFEDDISSKQALLSIWEKGWNTLFNTLKDLGDQDLLKVIYIRREAHTVLEAIERQQAHYASHIGQIVFIGKQLKGEHWKSLSIPKGKSEEYLQQKLNRDQQK
ncbi:DUF1572 family protein [Sediminibacillus albus]|uniref:DUF1572 domain-containing protein n=1 Tax=Sediminibacillus albus TaxID=407036 RepID=A0A1G8WLP4_9BACI|nr:DUF1572 family protein [Sediminibacillus albus]SDJ79101.1 Protein of unknown function [Sediminibacillus albus]